MFSVQHNRPSQAIFQDGGRRHLGFLKLQIFNGRTHQKGELHHRAKFRRNRSNCSQDMAIFAIFKDDGRRFTETKLVSAKFETLLRS